MENQNQPEVKPAKAYKKLYLTKYKKALSKNNIDVDTREFLDQAFTIYLDLQLKKAEFKALVETKEGGQDGNIIP